MARFDPSDPTPELLAFVTDRHLATLTLIRPDGTPHVTPVGFTFEPEQTLVRVITWASSMKARLITSAGSTAAAVSQVDGGRWLTFEGTATVTDDPTRCAEGVRRYAERYRQPKERDDRVVIELAVTKIMGRA